MTDVVIGVDVGTSFTKLSCILEDGTELSAIRSSSPRLENGDGANPEYAASIWRLVGELILDAAGKMLMQGHKIRGLAICAISPVLVHFDAENPDRSLALPYWWLPRIDGRTLGIERTVRRVVHLRGLVGQRRAGRALLSDLVGYLNFRLTGRLTINSLAAAELGIGGPDELQKIWASARQSDLPVLVSPSHQCGVAELESLGGTMRVTTFGGASDSFGAVLACGAHSAGSGMIYLGTFGSLLKATGDALAVATGPPKPVLPYRWLISVPNFGRTIEQYAVEAFPEELPAVSLRRFIEIAAEAVPGGQGLMFHLPRWNVLGEIEGSFGYSAWRGTSPPSSALKARAILEAIAYLVRSHGDLLTGLKDPIGLEGGGAGDLVWVQMISDVLGRELCLSPYPGGAIGAGMLAALGLRWNMNPLIRPLLVRPDPKAHASTSMSAEIAKRWYSTASNQR